MLTINIKDGDMFNEITSEFIPIKGCLLHLEHSLISLSKWESKHHEPFLQKLEQGKLSLDDTIDYIKCMTLNNNVDENIYNFINREHISKINAYISDPMTATTVNNRNKSHGNKEILTSEVIYFYMIELGIPVELEKWHLNRLMMLIQVCNAKNGTGKKMSKKDIISQNAALNEARRKKFNTKG